MKRGIVLFVGLIALLDSNRALARKRAGPSQPRSQPPANVEQWLGRETWATLKGARRVQVLLVGSKPMSAEVRRRDGKETVGGFPIQGTGPVSGLSLAQRISSILLDEASYSKDVIPFGRLIKSCAFSPNAVFRIWDLDDDHHIDVWFSAYCNQVQYSTTDGEKRPAGEGDVTPSRKLLVRFLKDSFPDVVAIQSLEEVR